ncbi:M20 family metallopeptidase [Lichenihabitans sp. PAMC28606]|uniref:M20 aminoacylase family protein n=1 Tax=Lichenihabitans sp. PAMC28606 TaxID=2880932 RepID=UPI001D0BBBC4|nr:M20 aminoacylase family protein [Lichenihabitans sp. PAMC28606]UDL94093.1 M20 family metallopeptidase [Lichenihabitans sp. PAMC28606]
MPVINSVAEATEEVKVWRRDFHRHPELLYDVHRTAGLVADRLRAFGCDEVVTGIGRTGVVGIIRGNRPGPRTIAMRADMDALPITELSTTLPHASTTPGRMHACGHDGHTAMLLGAAQYLTGTRNFAGTAVVVFQPAEEGGGGGKAMVSDGLMARFGIDEIYGMHSLPGLPVGHFALRPGPIMAAADRFEIRLDGRGGHAANPHLCIDPVLAGAQITTALQMIVARNVDPLDACVVSVTQFNAGSAGNAIPQSARLGGTVRSLKAETRVLAERRLREIVAGVAAASGVDATVNYAHGYPVTVNHADQARFAATVAADVSGAQNVDAAIPPMMGAEDFSYMLEERPGAFLFIGNGDSAGLHNPGYDFDDTALPYGISFWGRLVETALRP